MSAHTDRRERSGGFTRFLRALSERWWLVLLTTVIVGVVVYAVSLALEPKYSAVAQVAYSQRDADTISKALTDAGTAGLPKTLSNDSLIMTTSGFAERVSQSMGGAVSPETLHSTVEVSVSADVELLYIEATAARARSAADIANAYADEFMVVRQEEIVSLLQSAQDFVLGQLVSLTLDERAGSVGTELERQSYALHTLIRDPVVDYKVLERATAPASPDSPRPVLNLIWGLFAGLLLGLLIVLIMTVLDRRVKDRDTLERVMNLPVLGSIPTIPGRQTGKQSPVGFQRGSESLLAPMKALRSNLKVLGFGDSKRTLLVTSTSANEDKSALAVDLTLSMALAGDRVILVDANLRHPSIHTHLGLPNTQGLTDVLHGNGAAWSDTIQAVDLAPFIDQRFLSLRRPGEGDSGVTKFLCLTSGSHAIDPATAFESREFADLLAELQGYSDYVIIDGPPMIVDSDSLLLATSVDSIVIASTLGRQTVDEARQVRQLLARAEIEALGVVLCGVRSQSRERQH